MITTLVIFDAGTEVRARQQYNYLGGNEAENVQLLRQGDGDEPHTSWFVSILVTTLKHQALLRKMSELNPSSLRFQAYTIVEGE